jgi:hypothetical protein
MIYFSFSNELFCLLWMYSVIYFIDVK